MARSNIVYDDPPKIDELTTNGLDGVSGSIAYRVHEIDRHIHSYERWAEAAAVPVGETHVADRLCTGAGAFQADAGNDDWGTWLQILGTADTPAIAGNVKFDLHKISILAQERINTEYCIQIAYGTSGAVALAAEAYTEFSIKTGGGNTIITPVRIQARRIAVGTKIWLRLNCPGQNTATLDFKIGLHEYEG